MENATEKIKKIGKILSASSLVYFGALFGVEIISNAVYPKISSQSDLEQILTRERETAGINKDTIINARISNKKDSFSYAKKIFKGGYEIVLRKESSTAVLRHELYHIADRHCDHVFPKDNTIEKLDWFAKYLFWEEPKAALYGAFGWKL